MGLLRLDMVIMDKMTNQRRNVSNYVQLCPYMNKLRWNSSFQLKPDFASIQQEEIKIVVCLNYGEEILDHHKRNKWNAYKSVLKLLQLVRLLAVKPFGTKAIVDVTFTLRMFQELMA